MMIRNRLVAVSLLFFLTVSASAQETAQEELELTTRVSQTSVWPGDRIHYIITLTVSEGVKVALEDFSVENVSFEPFVLVDKQQTEEAWGERTRYVFDYLIANYEIGDKQVEIPGLIFRYETAGQETNVPTTQEKQIPVQPMSVRSTLNQPIEESWIQEELPMATTSSQTWVALLAGIVGLTVSTIPLGAWAWKQIPDWQARRRQLSRKKFLTQCSVSLDRLERRLASDNVEIKEQYQALEELVQGYVQFFSRYKHRDLLPQNSLPS